MVTVNIINTNDKYSKFNHVEILPNGVANYYNPYGMTGERRRHIKDAIYNYFDVPALPEGTYLRCTNNKAEVKLIKSGELRPSINHADNTNEKGLSVADHLGYILSGYKYAYRVTGTVISTGSDGEYILDMSTLQPVDKTPKTVDAIRALLDPARIEAIEAKLSAMNWTREDWLEPKFDL
jgi:hypothetical protein